MARCFSIAAAVFIVALLAPAAGAVTLKLHGFQYEAPNLGGFADFEKVPVWGGGGELAMRCAHSPWGGYLGAGIGTGGHDFTPPLDQTEKTRLSAWYVRGGVDYHVQVGEVDCYGGPSLFWSSSRMRFEHPGETPEKLEPATFYGVEHRAGAMVPLCGRFSAYGEFSMLVGRSRLADDGHAIGVIQGWNTSSAFRGGFAIRL